MKKARQIEEAYWSTAYWWGHEWYFWEKYRWVACWKRGVACPLCAQAAKERRREKAWRKRMKHFRKMT